MRSPKETMDNVRRKNDAHSERVNDLHTRQLCVACDALGKTARASGCGDPRHTGNSDAQAELKSDVPSQPTQAEPAKWTDQDLDTLKELSRKLAWAVSSTLGLKGEAKGRMLAWAEGLSRKVLSNYQGYTP